MRRVVGVKTIAIVLASLGLCVPFAAAGDVVPRVPATSGTVTWENKDEDGFLLRPPGPNRTFKADRDSVIVEATPSRLRVETDAPPNGGLTITMATPDGGPLRPGTYAAAYPAAAGQMAFRMDLSERQCASVRATVTVSAYTLVGGHPTAIKVGIRQYCDGAPVATAATIDLRLDPWPAALAATLRVDPQASIDPATGAATVSGQLTCTRPSPSPVIDVAANQANGSAHVNQASSVIPPCRPGTTGYWAVRLQPNDGARFDPALPLQVGADAFIGDDYYPNSPTHAAATATFSTPIVPAPKASASDRHADLWTVNGTGELRFAAGDGSGGLLPSTVVGQGWGGVSALVPAGDWDGNGKTALLARIGGHLYVLRALEDGHLSSDAQPVGVYWDGMDQIVVAGRLGSGDTRYVLARRRADGTLWRYPIDRSGTLAAGTQVGVGWSGMRQLVAPGDFDGDGRADLLGLHSNGNLYAYAGTASGALGATRQVGYGWSGFTAALVPGDLSSDGRPDLVGLRADGNLCRYANRGGSWGAATQVATGLLGVRLLG